MHVENLKKAEFYNKRHLYLRMKHIVVAEFQLHYPQLFMTFIILKKLTDIKAELLDLSIEFAPTESMKLNIRELELTYDQKNELFIFGASKIAAPIINGKVKLRVLVDRASLELFVNEGATVASFCAEPPANNLKISLTANDEMKINSLVINVLKSSWANFK